MKWVKYEVNVGSGSANGSVLVEDNANDDDIRLAIMEDLYSVTYEIEDV
jgi:hypothetical protein